MTRLGPPATTFTGVFSNPAETMIFFRGTKCYYLTKLYQSWVLSNPIPNFRQIGSVMYGTVTIINVPSL